MSRPGEHEEWASSSSEPGFTKPEPTANPSSLHGALTEPRPVDPAVIGDKPTTFGAEPWWTDRNWNRLPEAGRPSAAVIENGVAGPLAVCGGSLRGRRHQLAGKPNDDAFEIATVSGSNGEPAWLIIAVCDGVGSAPHSSTGARLTATHAVALIAHSLRGRLSIGVDRYTEAVRRQGSAFLSRLTGLVRGQVDRAVTHQSVLMPNTPPPGTPLSELQTTLTVVGLRTDRTSDGEHEGFVVSVGDSPVFQINSDGIVPVSAKAQSSGPWSTVTEGVLGSESLDVHRLHLGPNDALMAATDGVGNFLHHDQSLTALGRYLHARWRSPLDSISFLRDLSFDLASADDDRTAVLVWPRP